MGEVIFRELAERAGVGEHFIVTSRGTGDWHEGDPADGRTRVSLASANYDGAAHRARQVDAADIAEHDLLIALDRGHETYLLRNGAEPTRVRLLTSFDPEQPSDPDVFDPYHSDSRAFDEVRDQVERSCVQLLQVLRDRIGV